MWENSFTKLHITVSFFSARFSHLKVFNDLWFWVISTESPLVQFKNTYHTIFWDINSNPQNVWIHYCRLHVIWYKEYIFNVEWHVCHKAEIILELLSNWICVLRLEFAGFGKQKCTFGWNHGKKWRVVISFFLLRTKYFWTALSFRLRTINGISKILLNELVHI